MRDNLSNRELDEACAREIMGGWKPLDSCPSCGGALAYYKGVPHSNGGYCLQCETHEGALPRYSTDANAVREVEAEMERRGLGGEYAQALDELTAHEDHTVCVHDWMFFMFRTSLRIRCLAALRAVKGGE